MAKYINPGNFQVMRLLYRLCDTPIYLHFPERDMQKRMCVICKFRTRILWEIVQRTKY